MFHKKSQRSPCPVEYSQRLPSCGGFNRVNVSAVKKIIFPSKALPAAGEKPSLQPEALQQGPL
jgi:hypothetical protein